MAADYDGFRQQWWFGGDNVVRCSAVQRRYKQALPFLSLGQSARGVQDEDAGGQKTGEGKAMAQADVGIGVGMMGRWWCGSVVSGVGGGAVCDGERCGQFEIIVTAAEQRDTINGCKAV